MINCILSAVCVHGKNTASTGWISIKFNILGFSKNLTRKLKFDENLPIITGVLLKDLCTFVIVSC
jgi:hypothetical protein